jgi:hypothetical protein
VQLSVAVVALLWASRWLQRGWWRVTVAPPFVAAVAGLGAGWLLPLHAAAPRPAIELIMHAIVFLVAGTITLRIFFGPMLHRLVTLMPAGHYLRGVLLFPKPRADAAPDTSAPLSQLSKP